MTIVRKQIPTKVIIYDSSWWKIAIYCNNIYSLDNIKFFFKSEGKTKLDINQALDLRRQILDVGSRIAKLAR